MESSNTSMLTGAVEQIATSRAAGPTSEAKFGRLVGPEIRENSAIADVGTTSAYSSPTSQNSLDVSLSPSAIECSNY